MANVKVHLKEITKYVLLLGTGIQIVLGVICSMLWLWDLQDFGERARALCGIVLCVSCGYIFLRLWNKNLSRKVALYGALGGAFTPVVMQAGLGLSRGSITGFWLTGVFIALLGIFHLSIKRNLKRIGVIAVFILAICICNAEGEAPSFAAKMTSRFCYPHVYAGVNNVPGELLEEAGYIELRDSLRSADGISSVLYPSLLERYGNEEDADRVCLKLMAYGFGSNTKNVIRSIVWDYAGYHFPLPVAQMQLTGYGYDAVTGYQYGKLLERTGEWGLAYWRYSFVWYGIMVLFVLPFAVKRCLKGSPEKKLLLLLLEVVVIFLVMQGAGVFDYTKLQIVQFIWMSQVLHCMEKVKRNEEN